MTHHPPAAGLLTVGITGATGFIGARLVEMLATGEQRLAARPLARRRTAPGGRTVDLRNPRSVEAAIAGCHAVAHFAFDHANLPANIEIARVLGRACAAAGVRLVHVSTAAVYEPFPDGMLDEGSEGGFGAGSDYKQVKLAIEDELLRQVREDGLDAVFLQPTVVYGPHGRAWTDSPIRELLTGTVVLPDDGLGLCNAVYVDDVCQAVIAAVTMRVPPGERFLISGAQPVSWRAFYEAYQAMLGLDAIRLAAPAPPEAVQAASGGGGLRTMAKRVATRLIGAPGMSRLNLALGTVRRRLLGRQVHVATGPKRALFRARCHVRIDKARQLLGYQPHFDLDQGMAMTRPYVRLTYGRLAGDRQGPA